MDTKVVLFSFLFFSGIAKTTRSNKRNSHTIIFSRRLSLSIVASRSSRDPVSYLFYYFHSLLSFFLRFLFYLARITRLSRGCIQNIVIRALIVSRAFSSFRSAPFRPPVRYSLPRRSRGKDVDEREEEDAPLRSILTSFASRYITVPPRVSFTTLYNITLDIKIILSRLVQI